MNILHKFGGETYDPVLDGVRLETQFGRVFEAMKDEQWHTLPELVSIAKGSEAGVSARIRDLRKPKFGGYVVEHRRVSGGLWEYRLQLEREAA